MCLEMIRDMLRMSWGGLRRCWGLSQGGAPRLAPRARFPRQSAPLGDRLVHTAAGCLLEKGKGRLVEHSGARFVLAKKRGWEWGLEGAARASL